MLKSRSGNGYHQRDAAGVGLFPPQPAPVASGQLKHGHLMNIHGVELIEKGDMVCLSYRNHGCFENESIRAWRQQAMKPNAVCVDVGAYTGIYAIMAAQEGATVYAFEPNPDNCYRMVKNFEKNEQKGQIRAYNAAVGPALSTCSMDDITGRPKLTSAGKVAQNPDGTINMVSIDYLKLERCDAIKIDVEGMECDVLEGARDTIERCKPLVIAEVLNDNAYADVSGILHSMGYTRIHITTERNILAYA